MSSVLIRIAIIVVTALLGGLSGAWFQYKFQNCKVSKVRRIAIDALKIFLNYAKKRQAYDLAAQEFNNKISSFGFRMSS